MDYLTMDVFLNSSFDPMYAGVEANSIDSITRAALEADRRSSSARHTPAPPSSIMNIGLGIAGNASTPDDLLLALEPSSSTTWASNSNFNSPSQFTPANGGHSSASYSPINMDDSCFIKAETPAGSPDPEDQTQGTPGKKRRQPWGRQLTPPTTNLPPRKRAKTDAEKQQRAYERVIRNRKAAETSRQRKQAQQDMLVQNLHDAQAENDKLKASLADISSKCAAYRSRISHLEMQLRTISDCQSAELPVPFTQEQPVTPIKIPSRTSVSTDHFVSPSALTCESPENTEDIFSPSFESLAGSPATVPEDDSPKTPTDAKNGAFTFSSHTTSALESVLLPAAMETKKPAAFDTNESFDDIYTALNYDRTTESTDPMGFSSLEELIAAGF